MFQGETFLQGRGSQVGKAEVCKTFMHRFDSGPRLHCRMFRKNSGHTVADLPPTATTPRVHHRENSNGKKRLCANPVELTLRYSTGHRLQRSSIHEMIAQR